MTGCSFHGTIGLSPALLIYAMDILLGDNYFNIFFSMLDDDLDHQLATVRSIARFVNISLLLLCFKPADDMKTKQK